MNLRLVCALAVLILGDGSPRASAVAPRTTVYPTGSFPLDVQNVQAAIDGGGTVLLKATNSVGQPTAFNFGPADEFGTGVNLYTDVRILGEQVGQYATTINGGFWPILGFVPVRSTIQGINFEGPLATAIVLFRSTGAEIVGNRFTDIVPTPDFLGEAEGIFMFGPDEHAITGRIMVRDNIIEMSAGDFTHGMQFDGISADIELRGNTVHLFQSNGVLSKTGITVVRSYGRVNIVNNLITVGLGDPDAIPSGIFVVGHAEARYMISGNTIITDHPNSDGIDVVGSHLSGPTENAVVQGNHIMMHSTGFFAGGIAFVGAVKNSLMSNNLIEGTSVNAIQMLGSGSTLTANFNRALGNDISQLAASEGDIFLGLDSTNNLVAGQCATYTDLGIGNRITCGHPLTP